MRLIRIASLGIGILSISLSAKAQDYQDVLRYSQQYFQGTARSAGVGNAMGAFGADFTAISINPAGLGLYRKNEFTGTLNFNSQGASTSYLGNTRQDDKYNLNISNLGLVFTSPQSHMGAPIQQGWVSVNFGVGYNRINNFHSNYDAEGYNAQNSIVQHYLKSAKDAGLPPNQLDTSTSSVYGAYSNFLLDYSGNKWRDIYSAERAAVGPKGHQTVLYQQDLLTTRGSMNDLFFAVAGNYSDRLFLGAKVGFPTIGYHSTRTFTEINTSDTTAYYGGSVRTDQVNTSGIGITAQLGLIYNVPLDAKSENRLRLGVSAQLPSFYSLSDNFTSSMSATIVDSGQSFPRNYTFPNGTFDYTIVTPWRTTASAAYVLGKQGFLSVDYEFVDYRTGRISADNADFIQENNKVQNLYKAAGNLRVGGEYRFNLISVRAGYGHYGSPFETSLFNGINNYDRHSDIFSLGIGLREQDYFLDLAYSLQKEYIYTTLYTLDPGVNVSPEQTTNTRGSLFFTIGTKF